MQHEQLSQPNNIPRAFHSNSPCSNTCSPPYHPAIASSHDLMNLGARNKAKLIKMMLSKYCNFTLWHFQLFKTRALSPTFGPRLRSSTRLGSSCFSLVCTEGFPQILRFTKVLRENFLVPPPPLTICGLSLCVCEALRLKNDSNQNSVTLHSSRSP